MTSELKDRCWTCEHTRESHECDINDEGNRNVWGHCEAACRCEAFEEAE